MQWGHVSCISSSTCSMEARTEGCHSLCRGVIPPGWKPKKTTCWILKAALPCADGVFPELGVMASRLSDAVCGSSNEELLSLMSSCCEPIRLLVIFYNSCIALHFRKTHESSLCDICLSALHGQYCDMDPKFIVVCKYSVGSSLVPGMIYQTTSLSVRPDSI